MNKNQSKIIEISDESEFDKEVLKCDEPVIVDFHADWCGPCKKLGPLLEKACREEKCFKLVKVNVDDNQELSEEYKVTGIPHVFLFSNGKEISSFTGYDEQELKKMIEICKKSGKSKAFSGTGTVIDSNANFSNEDLPEEIFYELINSISPEPLETDSNCFNLVFKFNDITLTRRFSPDATIEELKLFVKGNLKTLKEIELFESFPRKVYSGNNSIKSSGISKNQILLVKII